ncbi:MAG: selenocysteine-specific translation elongation factor [Desulfuromonadaceae bacterium]|nr:selenocysteine-specific translation elongation factor [Desulfuromonadaceae bacterium]MDD5105080.1 selenocysteine-specific translation elongation factor [Desulfuromonadaceae bacterium]
MSKNLILGTAGHIDHGKTLLVKALTGVDTDRLPEEKSRGITIELGFASMLLAGDIQLGIVDVPGHERFVRAMVAGVGGMDMVMLVIAADEGVMPQTREHLDICRLLGVKQGLVVLTKSDLVDPEWLGLVTEEVRDFVAGSFLEGATIVPVSARSGIGIDLLKEELRTLAGRVDQKRSDGAFRLPVDRAFTVAGFGTVVTGTLLSGQVRVGDEVELFPSGICTKIRGIQVHGGKAEVGYAGQRLALNLQGVDNNQTQRGDVVAPRGLYRATRAVDVEINCLKSAPRPLKHRSTLRLHSATYEVSAQVILLDRMTLEPGESAFAQLRLATPVLLLNGDPFVLRSYSPSQTVGGGTILDPSPPRRRRRSAEALALLEAMALGDEPEMVERLVASSLLSGISFQNLILRSGLSAKRLDAALSLPLSSGRIIQMVRDPRIFLGRDSFHNLCEILRNRIKTYLAINPIKEGISREELKTRIPARSDGRFFGQCLQYLENEKRVVADRDQVRLPDRAGGAVESNVDVQQKLEDILAGGGAEPPTVKELCEQLALPEKIAIEHLSLLVRQGRAVKVKNDLFYAPAPLQAISETMVAYLREKGEITPAEFREITGLSRKFMIPVLEYFDSLRITVRAGDKRFLRRK